MLLILVDTAPRRPYIPPMQHRRVCRASSERLEIPLDGGTAMFDVQRQRTVMLNATATAVWSLVDDTRCVEEIATAVAEQFGIESSAVHADVVRCVAELRAARLLEE